MPQPGDSDLILNDRLADWGPRYVETPPGDYPFPQTIAEPWNAVTAALFAIIAIVWMIRLRGRIRKHPFLACCMPILLAGGIGGTLFHALRATPTFFLLDVVPINILGGLVSIYLWIHVGPRLRYLIGMIAFVVCLQLLGHFKLPTQWAVNVSYATLALVVLVPLALVLWKTHFRFAGWIYSGLASFALAWVCRIADHLHPLPMGTHWLWHIFGALTTVCLGEYFYRLEEENIPDWLQKKKTEKAPQLGEPT